jgi:hypothetical protein
MTRTHGSNWGSQLRLARKQQQAGGVPAPQFGLEGSEQDPHHRTRELLRDAEAGEDAISKAADSGLKGINKDAPHSGWWSWDKGSTLFF